ncbi:MAG: SAM-dependent methyltransferase [Thiotrichales bacterium]|nr:SAM-dependent methyltransferase [Thiotrichales bacterium]
MGESTSGEEFQEYDDDLVAVLEGVWGAGYLSPGGPAEVDRIVNGLELAGKHMLDIGCGVGGAAVHLATSYRPAKVLGIDIEADLIERCRRLADKLQVSDRVEFQQVTPGPLVCNNVSFDLVFSKDAIIHIEDKHALANDIYRVLRPGGWFCASDWLAGYPDQPSPEMQAYIKAEGLDFGLADVATYVAALTSAGFVNITTDDRNAWYREEARVERDRMAGPLSAGLRTTVGDEFLDHELDVWDKMIVALDQGQLRPTHLRAQKPS